MINTVRGVKDIFDKKYLLYKRVSESFEQVMCQYDCRRLIMPVMEYVDLYGNVGATSDIVIKEMFYIKARNQNEEENVVLRPEGTMSCIRHLINTGQIDKNDIRLFYNEKMFRYSRPQKGREREFFQLGCEVINNDSVYTEAEFLKCLYFFVKSLGVDFKLHLNTTGSRESLKTYMDVLAAFFREKKDYLSEINQNRLETNVLRVLDQLSENEKNILSDGFPNLLDYVTEEEKKRFLSLCSILQQLNVDFVVDQFIIRGLDYYEGCIFELVAPSYSIAGGGRYRIARNRLGFKGSDIIGFGWAIGYERLVENLACEIDSDPLYIIFALDENEFCFEIAEFLRGKGKKTRIVFDSMKKCMSYADYINPNYVIFCGSVEKEKRLLNIRNWQSRVKMEFSFPDVDLDF